MQETLKAADDQGVKAIMLIGDAEYYGMFGFDASHARQWDLPGPFERHRSEEHTSELQSLMRISYAVFCLKKKKYKTIPLRPHTQSTSYTTRDTSQLVTTIITLMILNQLQIH